MTADSNDRRITKVWHALQTRVDKGRVVLLAIGDNETLLAIGSARMSDAGTLHRLPVGSQTTARALGMNQVPTPQQLERVIEQIEDAVMPLFKLLRPYSVLFVEAAALAPFWRAHAPAASVSVGDVEIAFQDLAAVAEGRPASRDGGTSQPPYAVSLLILREAMHHLGFQDVRNL